MSAPILLVGSAHPVLHDRPAILGVDLNRFFATFVSELVKTSVDFVVRYNVSVSHCERVRGVVLVSQKEILWMKIGNLWHEA